MTLSCYGATIDTSTTTLQTVTVAHSLTTKQTPTLNTQKVTDMGTPYAAPLTSSTHGILTTQTLAEPLDKYYSSKKGTYSSSHF